MKLLGPDGNSLPGEELRLFEIMWAARKERGTTVGARLLQSEKLDKIKSLGEIGGPKHDAK